MATHVLIVRNDPATSNLLSSLLSENGYQPTVLADPRAVVPFLRKISVNLVLLDVALPYIDGFILCATLRTEHPNIPVIFLAEHDTLRDKVMGFNQGADDCIGTPFRPDRTACAHRGGVAPLSPEQRYRRQRCRDHGGRYQSGSGQAGNSSDQTSVRFCLRPRR